MEKNTEVYSQSGGENQLPVQHHFTVWMLLTKHSSWLFWPWQFHTLPNEKIVKACQENLQFPSAQANKISQQLAPVTGGLDWF